MDNGLYVHLGKMDLFVNSNHEGPAALGANTYDHVVLTNDTSAGNVSVYVNGALDSATATNFMNIDAGHQLSFFLDDGVPFIEWSSGDVALIRVYDSVLDAGTVAGHASDPFANLTTAAPEPATVSSLVAALTALLWRRRR